MSSSIRFFVSAILLFVIHSAFAQSLEYVENKGQWDSKVKFKSDMGGSAFFLQQQGYKVVLNNKEDMKKVAALYSGHFHDETGSHFVKSAAANPEDGQRQVTLRSFAYEVSFVGSSPDATIVPDKPLDTYNNYFQGSDKSKWASKCKVFQAVTYKNIYKGVDARYYTDKGNLKYDLIVHPGADVSKIALRFDGISGLSLKNKNLIIKTALGEVSELRPYCYQLNEKGRADVEAGYSIEGNTVRFKISNYSKTATLIIDPTIVFASFTGSLVDNWGYTATYDAAGNFYAGGIAFGSGYPTSTGAYQENFGGGSGDGYDVAIIKLSSVDGSSRLYATYLGGGGNEQPHSMIVDNQGNLVVAGRTDSPNFPATSATFGTGGKEDIFISKLSADGSLLLGSRKIGGPDDDGVNIRSKETIGPLSISRNYGDDARSEVIVDGKNNIYLASATQSSTFPVTAGAFQGTSGGSQDGVLIKTSSDLGNILFSSFLGGGGDDAAFALSLNPLNDNIYVAGATTSNNLKATGGNNGPILFSTYQGGTGPQPGGDGFISIISNDGSTQIKTCYVGTSGNDMVYGVQFDKLGFPYITGTTTIAFPVIQSAFNASGNQAGGKQFITKMKTDLSGVVYSANFGKGFSVPDISTTAFLVDRCENVYVAGWGGGLDVSEGYPNANTTNLSVTPDAIRSASDGSDFYFFILEKNALSQLYGTYYGNFDNVPDVGDHVDGGTSRFDKEGVIYEALCANCNGIGIFPTTPGNVWGRNNNAQSGAGCNEAALKIAFEFAGVGSAVRSAIDGVPRDTSGCLPLTVDFTDTIATGKQFVWDFGDGSPEQTTTIPSNSHIYNTLGTFRVRLVSIDSLTCNIADTSYTNIRVRDDKAYINFNTIKLPPCESLNYQFNNTSVAPVNKPFNAQSFEWDFGDGTRIISNLPSVNHSYPAPGTYNIVLRLIDTSYCNSPDSATTQLRVAPNVKAQFETPPYGCVPYTAAFNNISLAGQQFFWDFGDNTSSTVQSPTHTYNLIGTYTIKLVAVDTSTCNKIDSTEQTITVSAKPTSLFTYGPQPAKENTATVFVNFSQGATLYKWVFGDGDSLVTANRDTTVSHIYNATGIYNACLITYNNFGCTDTLCQPVQAIIIPLLDVPNAFTPNGDGVNDQVTVKGYGIQKMDWRIYNRWGTLIFQTNNTKQGWDGTYKGAIQPQEVYVYVLDVTFSDGKQFRKKGDITLLR
ncbi:MAG TPA: PKD domain-containing protein [Panacibacter sp.]|nr:PKD domain-containing protein [Panacibacter sp.]